MKLVRDKDGMLERRPVRVYDRNVIEEEIPDLSEII